MDLSIQIISFSNGNEQTSNLLLIITYEFIKTEITKMFFLILMIFYPDIETFFQTESKAALF